MDLTTLIEINKKFNEVHQELNYNISMPVKEAPQVIRLISSYMDDVQRKLHEAIGEATVSGKLEK